MVLIVVNELYIIIVHYPYKIKQISGIGKPTGPQVKTPLGDPGLPVKNKNITVAL